MTEATFPKPLESWQRKLCEILQPLVDGAGVRLLIHKPPQHGGSVIVSQRLIPYYLGAHPAGRVKLLTYGITHSERVTVVLKSIISSEVYQRFFPCSTQWEITRTSDWVTPERKAAGDAQPSFSALGLESGFTGEGADLVVIDDPYANREQAFSKAINEKIWNLWKEVILPRLTADTNIVVMYHSYSEDDFAARLQKSGMFTRYRFAAICDDESEDPCGRAIGAALSPRYPTAYLEALRDGGQYEGKSIDPMGAAAFESLFQGNPMPRGGDIFQRDWFTFVPSWNPEGKEEEKNIFISYWDLGASDAADSDRTARALLTRPNKRGANSVYLDVRFARKRKYDRNKWIRQVVEEDLERYGKYGRVMHFIERTFGMATEVTDEILRECQGLPVFGDAPKGTKTERADPLIAALQAGHVTFVEAPWNQAMLDECMMFRDLPSSARRKDDIVDVLVGAHRMSNKFLSL